MTAPSRSHRRTPSAPFPPAETDLATATVLNAFRRLVRAIHESSRVVEKQHGISAAQLFVLRMLARHGPQSLSGLAHLTMTHQSSVSVVVRRLTERGLVVRERARDDGRRLDLSIAPAGMQLIDQAPATVQEQLVLALGALAPDQRQSLAVGLTELIERLGLEDENAWMLNDEALESAVVAHEETTAG